jgi:hypothetical protein
MILQDNTLHFQHVLHFLTLRRIAFCDIALGWTTLNTYMLIYWHILTLWRYSAAHSIPFDSIPFNSILAELWWFTNRRKIEIMIFRDDSLKTSIAPPFQWHHSEVLTIQPHIYIYVCMYVCMHSIYIYDYYKHIMLL